MKKFLSQFFGSLVLGVLLFAPSYMSAATGASQSKFCTQLDAQKKEQLNKLALGKKNILDQEAKASDALSKRNDLFVASTTATLATQKKDVAALLNDLTTIATTDDEQTIVSAIATTTTNALVQKQASTTGTLASTTKIVMDASKNRSDMIGAALTTYEQSIKTAFDTAAANCATSTQASLASAKFDTETKTAKAELQKNELQAKIITDTIELTYADAKLKLGSYDKDFAKVLNDVQAIIKKTFTEE